jgi:hypothetical protein
MTAYFSAEAAAFLFNAHRRRVASAMAFLPSGDITRFFLAGGTVFATLFLAGGDTLAKVFVAALFL